MISVRACYKLRFPKNEQKERNAIWQALTAYLQQFIDKNDTVMDIGAGYCEFLNNVFCGEKIAVDTNPDTKKYAKKDIKVLRLSVFSIPKKYDKKIGKIFMSNFLEHLNSKEDVIAVLHRCHSLLKPGGKLIILQPNIDLVKERYWDFIDHKVPLNQKSLSEALVMENFRIERFVTKFLPYTTKTAAIPKSSWLVTLYLFLPPMVRPFAGQSFVIAQKV